MLLEKMEHFLTPFYLIATLTLDVYYMTFVWLLLFYHTQDL